MFEIPPMGLQRFSLAQTDPTYDER